MTGYAVDTKHVHATDISIRKYDKVPLCADCQGPPFAPIVLAECLHIVCGSCLLRLCATNALRGHFPCPDSICTLRHTTEVAAYRIAAGVEDIMRQLSRETYDAMCWVQLAPTLSHVTSYGLTYPEGCTQRVTPSLEMYLLAIAFVVFSTGRVPRHNLPKLRVAHFLHASSYSPPSMRDTVTTCVRFPVALDVEDDSKHSGDYDDYDTDVSVVAFCMPTNYARLRVPPSAVYRVMFS